MITSLSFVCASILAGTAGLLIGTFVAVLAGDLPGPFHSMGLGWMAGLFTIAVLGWLFLLPLPLGRLARWVPYWILAFSLALALIPHESSIVPGTSATMVVGKDTGTPISEVPLTAWGQTRQGIQMHPHYEGAVTVDAIRLMVPPDMTSGRLAFAQPEWALLRPDGSPTGGDGVEVVASGVIGQARVELDRFHLTPSVSRTKHWITRPFKLPDGLSALEISVTQGPGASTTYHDSTFVSVSFASPLTWLAERGQRLARILSLTMPLCAGWYLLIPGLKRLRLGHLFSPEGVQLAVSLGSLILAVNIFVAYWTTHSRYIFIWDNIGYWGFVQDLAATLKSQGLSVALSKVISSLKDEYNLVPALPPAIFGAWLSDIDRRTYITLLANLYFVPACLAVYWLVHIMLARAGETQPPQKPSTIFPLVLCAIGLYPVFFRVVLWGQPDLGGVVLVVAAILLFDTALKNIADKTTDPASPDTVAKLFSQGVLLALTLLLLMVFRRWYLFMAASLSFIASFQFLVIFVRQESEARAALLRKGMALSAGGVIFLCASVPAYLIERIRVMLSNSYASAYAAYARDWSGEFNFLKDFLGPVPLSLGLVLLIYSLIAPGDRRLRWLALGSAPMALALFWSVQRGMGLHHLSLIFVALTVAIAQGVWALQNRWTWPVVDTFLVAGTLLVLTIWTCGNQYPRPVGLPYADLLPPIRSDTPELLRLGHFINNEIKASNRKYCVLASGYTFSLDTIAGLWQLNNDIDFRNLGLYSIPLAQVDSRDGPPEGLKKCDLVLVSDPPQTHLLPDFQRCVTLPVDDLINGKGIGKAFRERQVFFNLENGVTIKVFERIRDISFAEWDDFLRRFNMPH